MKMKFKVTYDDGREFDVTAKDADVIAFERQFDLPFSAMTAGENLHLEWLNFIAWAAMHRTGQEPGDFQTFLNALDEADVVGQPVKSDPTSPAATDDASVS